MVQAELSSTLRDAATGIAVLLAAIPADEKNSSEV